MNSAVLLTRDWVFSRLPRRAPESHKGAYGKVLALCGCAQYRGAAALSVLGALRAGAGLVTLAAPECVAAAVAPRALEATFLPDPNPEALRKAAAQATVCLLGCGRHADPATEQEICAALDTAQSAVLDAGGLCSLAGRPERMAAFARSHPLIVTPHPGEMARLCGLSAAQVQAAREACALDFSRRTGAVTVLKGRRTLIACPDGRLFENTTGNAGLARGGSGDILAGIIAGLAAQGLAPEDAAAVGVWLHGAAADRCAARLSMQGMLPEEILFDLCAIFLENGR